MARRPFIAGNWKLNLGPAEAVLLSTELSRRLVEQEGADIAVFPTALSVTSVIEAVRGAGIEVGLQEIHHTASGAFTGTNSATMARSAGCTRVLVGHSERRQLFGETDAGVAAKVRAALGAGLLPVICGGETLEEREGGRVDEVVLGQFSAALEGLQPDQLSGVTLAYEPVWAIGTGRVATPQAAQVVHSTIRAWLSTAYPAWVAEETRILYGGSVKAANAAGLMTQPDIDGALVGGASLKVDDFCGIISASLAAR